jgi:hypothetical protein
MLNVWANAAHSDVLIHALVGVDEGVSIMHAAVMSQMELALNGY